MLDLIYGLRWAVISSKGLWRLVNLRKHVQELEFVGVRLDTAALLGRHLILPAC